MEIKTKLHTIFLLIGPTESGKTTFAKQVLMPQLVKEDTATGYRTNVQYISSDDIRQELLGYEYHKHNQIMLESSEQAFHLLFEKLKAVSSFPINAEFIIVDTTGLSEEFRQQVALMAKDKNYHLEAIVFDYKNRDDFYTVEGSKRLITNHVTRLKRDVLKDLAKLHSAHVYRIRDKDFFDPSTGQVNANYQVIIEDYEEYLSHLLPQQYKYIVVGDVHERIDELRDLLYSHGFSVEDDKMVATEKRKEYRIVLVGDWIDKGKATKETIKFIYENREWFYLLKGNHENFVSKYLTGHITPSSVDQELIDDYFTSIFVLQNDEEFRSMFLELVHASKEFYRFIGQTSPSFFVTHAPCQNKYLGKIDKHALKQQRRFSLDRTMPFELQLSFLEKEAVTNHPYHLFGHVATKEIMRIKNKINLDTGCVHRNALTSVEMGSWKPFVKQQKAKKGQREVEELPVLFKRSESNVSISELVESDKKRLHYVLKHKINFISGTMSPADKDVETNELESLKQGLTYFKNLGVTEVVLQPKYMGSRCNVYLNVDINECYAVSRNGYRINQIDLTSIYEELLTKHRTYMNDHQLKTLVLDGELLPWRALGEGLITRQFHVVEKALETELSFLKEHKFDEHVAKAMTAFVESDFSTEQHKASKKEVSKKYGDATYQTYKAIANVKSSIVSLDEHIEAFKCYKRQLELYGQEAGVQFKPFSILKVIKQDGSEDIPVQKTSEMFEMISDDEYKLIQLNQSGFLEEANEFFHTLTTEKQMEGVVIKPELPVPHAAPYLKVRNQDYLSIVYGYDYRFPHKYAKLMKQKNTKKKLRTSMNEFQLGMKMLKEPHHEIHPQNKQYQQIVANLLFEVSKEKDIDPRL